MNPPDQFMGFVADECLEKYRQPASGDFSLTHKAIHCRQRNTYIFQVNRNWELSQKRILLGH